MSFETETFFAGSQIPDLDHAVISSRGQVSAIGTPGHREHVAAVAVLQGTHFLTGDGLPDLDNSNPVNYSLAPRYGNLLTVRAPGNRLRLYLGEQVDIQHFFPRGRLPNLQSREGRSNCGNALAVGTPAQRLGHRCILQSNDILARSGIPDP